MRGSPVPHPALLVSSNKKWTYAATAYMPIVGISEGPGVNIAYSRSLFANTQCEQSEAASRSASVFNIKLAYTATADMPTVAILEVPGVNIVYSSSHFANTQCEAVRARIPLC